MIINSFLKTLVFTNTILSLPVLQYEDGPHIDYDGVQDVGN